MKSFRITLSLALVLVGGVVFFGAVSARAMTCESTCNQIRRACRSVAKANLMVSYVNCDDGRDTCRAACEANAEQCPIDCQTAFTTCGGSSVPGCDDQLAQCLDDCASCNATCNSERVACRAAAMVVRDDANVVCDGARSSCDTICVDPIDAACVRDCRIASSDCQSDAKRDEKTCRAGCPKGTGQHACVRSCRRDKNAAFSLCSNSEVLCIGTCAGL